MIEALITDNMIEALMTDEEGVIALGLNHFSPHMWVSYVLPGWSFRLYF